MSKISCVPLQLALVLALEEDQGQGPYRYPLMRPCWLDEHRLLSAVVARAVYGQKIDDIIKKRSDKQNINTMIY